MLMPAEIPRLARACADLIVTKVGHFQTFHWRRLAALGVSPPEGLIGAAEVDDGVETVSCVVACSAQSALLPIFMGVPPLGDLHQVMGAVLSHASLPAPTIRLHHTLSLPAEGLFGDEGLAGVILLPAATLGYLGGLPSPWAGPDGVLRAFVLPVFLDADEYRLARQDPGELMDALERSGRDLMSVRRRFLP